MPANASPEIGPTPIDGLREASIDIKIRFRPELPESSEAARPQSPSHPRGTSPEAGEASIVSPKLSLARVLLVRHGQSTWNGEHRIQGQLDPPLSEKGRRQAMRVAERLARRLGAGRLAGFYSSDLKRAFETAQSIGEATGAAPTPSTALREIYLGQWEGLSTDEIAQRFPEAWAQWSDEPSWDAVPGGEGAAQFETRVEAELDSILARHEHGDVVVVTHGGVIQVALHRVVGRPNHGLFPFRIDNASISVIERQNGRFVVSAVNDTSHLEGSE